MHVQIHSQSLPFFLGQTSTLQPCKRHPKAGHCKINFHLQILLSKTELYLYTSQKPGLDDLKVNDAHNNGKTRLKEPKTHVFLSGNRRVVSTEDLITDHDASVTLFVRPSCSRQLCIKTVTLCRSSFVLLFHGALFFFSMARRMITVAAFGFSLPSQHLLQLSLNIYHILFASLQHMLCFIVFSSVINLKKRGWR